MEIYQMLVDQSPRPVRIETVHYQVFARVVETEAGMTGSPKYDRSLAVTTIQSKSSPLRLRVALVRTKSGSYRLVENSYLSRPANHVVIPPIVLFETDSRLAAITRFEEEYVRQVDSTKTSPDVRYRASVTI